MKTNAIIRIVVWSLVLLILVSILCGFLAEERYLNDYRVSVLNPASDGAAAEVSPDTPLPNEETLTIDPASIRELEIEWVSGDILIQTADVDQITIRESDVSDEKYAMVYSVNNRKLSIRFTDEVIRVGIGISINTDIRKDLNILVPRDWTCDSVEIDAASAAVEMNHMTIRELDFDGASGSFTLNDCQVRDMDIDTASGDVYFTGTMETLDFDAASASFIGELRNTPSRIDMDGMSGTLDLTLPEDCGYSVTMDGLSSSFRTEFQPTTLKNDSQVYGSGSCRIDVDGMSCDIILRKAAPFSCPEPDCTIPEVHTHLEAEETFQRDAFSETTP